MLTVKNLSYSYDQELTLQFKDFTLKENEHCLILGNSGSGKTTLLHLIGGLLKPQTGNILIGAVDLNGMKWSKMDQFRGRNLGFVFQKPHLVQALNVEENMYLSQYLAGLPQDRKRVLEVLEMLDINQKRKSKVFELSQGQAQRATIARAVLNKPVLLLADEPTSSLDDENCDRVINLLRQQADLNGATLIISTHDQRVKDKIAMKITL